MYFGDEKTLKDDTGLDVVLVPIGGKNFDAIAVDDVVTLNIRGPHHVTADRKERICDAVLRYTNAEHLSMYSSFALDGKPIAGDRTVDTLDCSKEFEIAPSVTTTIYVRTLTGKSVELQISQHAEMYELKHMIAKECEIPFSMLRVIWAGFQLSENHRTIESWKMPPYTTIHVCLPLRGGGNAFRAPDPSHVSTHIAITSSKNRHLALDRGLNIISAGHEERCRLSGAPFVDNYGIGEFDYQKLHPVCNECGHVGTYTEIAAITFFRCHATIENGDDTHSYEALGSDYELLDDLVDGNSTYTIKTWKN